MVLRYVQDYHDRINSVCRQKFRDSFLGYNNLWNNRIVQIFFPSGQTILDAEAVKELKKLATDLKTDTNAHIDLVGRTDSFGSPSANQRLATHRAKAVRNMLLQYGIPFGKMDIIGNEEAPVFLKKQKTTTAEQRRVDVIISRE